MRVFLTGANGFLGREIARELRAHGHVIAGLLRQASEQSSGGHDICGDFLKPETYRDALKDFAPDALVHCGWHGVAASERETRSQLENVPAAGELVAAAAEAGARIAVGLGSQAEYGHYDHLLSEDAVTRPVTLYGIAKLAAGASFLRIARQCGMRGVWARIFSLYGPGETAPTMLSYLARTLAAGQTPALTPCTQIWDYLHVRDAARAIDDLLAFDSAQGVFNIATGQEIVLRDVVLHLRDIMAPGIEPQFGAVPIGSEQSVYLAGNVAKLMGLAGWRPQVTLDQGLREIAREAQLAARRL